jgi:hypothetical protein
VSSGDLKRHRLSRLGDRQLNRALYVAALCQIRHDTAGRAYYRRKLGEHKTPAEALRSLKRQLSNVVYATSSPTSDRPRSSVPDPRSATTRRRWPANPPMLLGSLA